MKMKVQTLALAAMALTLLTCGTARAENTSTAEAIKALQAQVTALQKQLVEMQSKEATRAAAEAAKPMAKAEAKEEKKEILPGVSVKLGGYLSMDGVYRTNEMTTDTSSSFGNIPYANSIKSETDEFRGSARNTRLSLLAEGKPDADTKLTAFVEADFNGAGTTSNGVQSNSYDLRLRHAYAQVDRNDWGFHFLAGQAFSMVSLYKSGIEARKEVGIATADSFGSPGYVYTRNPGVRFVKDFADKKAAFGLAFEAPEVNFGGITPPANVTARNSGLSPLNPNATYSTNMAPDVIAKIAYDSSFGHYELFGLTRFFRDVVNATGDNNYAMGYGVGAGFYVPVMDKKIELTGNVLAGRGIGRYSAGQLADIAFTPSGDIRPVGMMAGLVGVIAHPTPNWDLYTYFGAERALREAQGGGGVTYGYGNFTASNAGCNYLGGTTCQAQTETVWQITPGFWKQVYKGDYGSMKVGGQYAYMRKSAFTGANDVKPSADDNVFMLSFRYFPF